MKLTAKISKTDGREIEIHNIEYVFKTDKEIYFILKEDYTEYEVLYRPIKIFRLTEITELVMLDEFNFEFWKEGRPD